MKLEIGDIVVFKNYEDLSLKENLSVPKDKFPKFGKVESVTEPVDDVMYFTIEGSTCIFKPASVAGVIIDTDNVHYSNPSDEELINTIIKEIFNRLVQIESSINKTDLVKILNRQKPEHFIVKESYYNMYIGAEQTLVSDKNKAKIFTSRSATKAWAINMHLNEWDVIPYDD